MIADVEQVLREVRPAAENILAQSTLAAWLRGADEVAKLLPPSMRLPPPEPPPRMASLFPEGEPAVEFPLLDQAADRLAGAEIVSPAEFRALGDQARRQAFTITTDMERSSIAEIRDLLAENVARGADREAFLRDVADRFEGGLDLSEARLEQVFRNNVNAAWSDGHEDAARHPLVADAFPYRAYFATSDERTRPEHRALETLGLSGTNVYHKDDPVWQLFRPPWDWGCRCDGTPITIAMAASMGVAHAKRWLAAADEAGVEPEQLAFDPEFVDMPSFRPPPEWRRSGVL